MAATKDTPDVIHNNVTLTAGAGDTTSSAWDVSAGYGGMLYIKLTNGATGPTVPAQVQVQFSPDDSNYYDHHGPIVGSTANSAVVSRAVVVPVGVKYVKTVSGSNTAQDVTLRVEGTDVSAL